MNVGYLFDMKSIFRSFHSTGEDKVNKIKVYRAESQDISNNYIFKLRSDIYDVLFRDPVLGGELTRRVKWQCDSYSSINCYGLFCV